MNISKINTQNCIRSNIAFQIETKPSFVSQTEDINSFYNTNLLTDSLYSKNKYHKQIIVSSKDIDYLNKIKKEYSKKFYILTNGYTKPATINIGKDILKLFNQYNKEVLKYAEQNHINYISSENLSINELRKFINFIDLIIPPNTTKKISSINKNHINLISFNGTKIELTEKQKKECHYIIHSYSLVCAGISAMMGEACAAGADIPFLVTAETGMFAALAGTLNAPWGAAMLHGAKHMSSAGIIGGKVLKWINSIASIGGHVVTGPTTGGIGNVAISSYLRASNAALTASFCEAMGWAFVKDYKNGLMTTKQKSKELIAFGVFNMLISGFDSHLDLENPASFLDSTISKAFGMSLANNMPSQYASFINASMKILSKHPITMVAKGLEIITPALASHLIENNGKIKDNFLENIIKGSIYSLVCGNLLGNNSNNYQITTKSKNYIIYMMNDPYIQKLIENNLISNGIKSYGKYKIDKNTLDSLESIYNELIPRITDIIKTTKGL